MSNQITKEERDLSKEILRASKKSDRGMEDQGAVGGPLNDGGTPGVGRPAAVVRARDGRRP